MLSIKKSTKNNWIWIIISLFIIISTLVLNLLFVYLVGFDIIKVFLKASYLFDFILIFTISIILLSFNFPFIYKLYMEIKLKKKIIHIKIAIILKIISAILLTLIIIFSILSTRRYFYHVYGKKPTAPVSYIQMSGPHVQFGPYKNNRVISTSGKMIIWWYSPVKSSESQYLMFGKSQITKNMIKKKEIPHGDGKRHEVKLENLSPSTTYYYYIPGFDNNIYNFSTGPDINDKSSFNVLCIGDTSNHGGLKYSYYGEINSIAGEFYGNKKIKPAFKLLLGDIAYRGNDLDSWRIFFDNGDIHNPYLQSMTAFGNHESYRDYGGNFNYFFNRPRYYSFTYGNAHFIAINPFDGFKNIAGKDQYKFIKGELKKYSGKKWIIIFLHVPPLSTGDFNMNRLLIAQFYSLFRKYKVDLVLAGHDHHYDSFWIDKKAQWGGTIYIVNGGGGSRVDDYIMRRNHKSWQTWYHQRTSDFGLYLHDEITRKYHIYGELSWGFLDIKINANKLTTSYYRWMDIEKFLTATDQTYDSWKMMPIRKDIWEKFNFSKIELVHKLQKTRRFNK
ncbi:purple acid phosphatase family protein [Spirochaetota bacterium]